MKNEVTKTDFKNKNYNFAEEKVDNITLIGYLVFSNNNNIT